MTTDAFEATVGEPAEPMATYVPPTAPPPPRGPRLAALLVVTVLLVIALVVGVVLGPSVQAQWSALRTDTSTTASTSGVWYQSQMHPWILQPEPGQCPICGMDLTPVDPDRFMGEIAIEPAVVQNLGVRIAPAQSAVLTRQLRSVGRVTLDESRISEVVQRFGGWVETVHVDTTWAAVEAGDPLFTIYAPEVYAAEREYLVARQANGPGAEAIRAAAIGRLQLLGLPEEEIQRLEDTGEAADSVVVRSPVTGVVWEKHINPGSQIMPMTVAYHIADLSQVWVEATLYEHHLADVQPGMPVTITTDYAGVPPIEATIDTIYPVVDAVTRESRARLVVANPMTGSGYQLKPGMFTTLHATLSADTASVVIPDEAVIGTGTRKVVFVSLGRGRFEPRNVVIGAYGDDGHVSIVDGLAAGEQVVVSGQFLLDSESRMREALAKVMRGDLASQQAVSVDAVELGDQRLSEAAEGAYRAALLAALDLHQALFQHETAEARTLASAAADQVAAMLRVDPRLVHRVPDAEALAGAVSQLRAADDLHALRMAYGHLALGLDAVIRAAGVPPEIDGMVLGARCSMFADAPRGGVWLQRGNDAIQNPFFGAGDSMVDCSVEEWQLPRADASAGADSTASSTNTPPSDRAADHSSDSPVDSPSVPSDLVVTAYKAIGLALYADDLNTAQTEAVTLAAQAWPGDNHGVQALLQANDLQAARAAYGQLSIALRDRLVASGASAEAVVYRCGMYRPAPDRGVWLQFDDQTPRNPFFGQTHAMADCWVERWQVSGDGLGPVEERQW